MMDAMNLEESDTKREVIEKLLEEGMVLVTLDSRAAGVRVPSHLCGDAQLRLNLSYRFGLPMEIDDEGISATLTFAGEPFACRIPWNTIYLVMSHVTTQPVLFPADVPSDGGDAPKAASIDEPHPQFRGSEKHERRAEATPRDLRNKQLRVITTPPALASDDPAGKDGAADSSQQQRRSRRGHLRVVK